MVKYPFMCTSINCILLRLKERCVCLTCIHHSINTRCMCKNGSYQTNGICAYERYEMDWVKEIKWKEHL